MKVSVLYNLFKYLMENGKEDLTVVLSRDGEGNSYSPLKSMECFDYSYIPKSPRSGDIKFRELTPELIEEGYGEKDTAEGFEEAVEAVVLWPSC